MKVLIVGGYGTFGGRLADLLADEAGCRVFIGGRSLAAAETFCRGRSGAANFYPVQIDRANPDRVLTSLSPDLVVDASGPFQNYGDDPYRLVRAALEANANYADLADGAAFVTGISALDQLAKSRGCFALAGLSSLPALSAAAVRHLSASNPGVEQIVTGIAPSPFAGIGLNVIRSVASYAGKPVELFEEGGWRSRQGLGDSRWMTVNVPGEIPLGPIRFALAEAPDLRLFPAEWPGLKAVWTGAGPRPALLHRLLWCAATLVRLRILPSLEPFAGLMHWSLNNLRWGEHRGGMIVAIVDQAGVARNWHLLADGDVGPFIPSMAACALVKRCVAGNSPQPGARPGHRDIELSDFDPLFRKHGIQTGVRGPVTGFLYPDALGEAYARLAEPVRHFHGPDGTGVWEGRAAVDRGRNPIALGIAQLFGFPPRATDVPVRVTLVRKGPAEIWERDFDGKIFRSSHSLGRGRFDGLVVEQFGPLRFGLALVERNGRLGLFPRKWSAFGLPMPRWAMPVTTAWEEGRDLRLHFDVALGLKVLGLVVHYKGWLVKRP